MRRRGSGAWSDLPDWLDESYPVTVNAEGEAWARNNAASVTAKRDKYLRVWLEKPQRPMLRPGDGAPSSEPARAGHGRQRPRHARKSAIPASAACGQRGGR
jgi:hypothetical protein